MKKSILISIVVVLLIGVAIGGYVYWNKRKENRLLESGQQALQGAGDLTEELNKNVTQGVLPSVTNNPLENKPDINPVDQTNPFKDINTNPFK